MTKTDLAKRVLGTAAQFGSGKILHNIVKNNVVATTPFEAVTVAVASFALGGAVGEVAKNHMTRTIDELVGVYTTIKAANPQA